MPNWCYNKLVVTGKSRDIKRFSGEVLPLSFKKIVPIPDAVSGGSERGFISNQEHNWRLRNWGSKWDIIESDGEAAKTTKTSVQIDFDTPYGPPTPIIKKLSEMYPELSFRLRFDTCEGKGVYAAKGGNTTTDDGGADPEGYQALADALDILDKTNQAKTNPEGEG